MHLLKTSQKYCACHTKRLSTRCRTRLNVTKCHACHAKRSNDTSETSKKDHLCKTSHRHGHTGIARTVANGCERLRTVANGCERLRTVANGCERLRTVANGCERLRTVANGCERLRTVANGCERLRTVANGCDRERNVERTHPQPPNPQSETGTLATHSGKKHWTNVTTASALRSLSNMHQWNGCTQAQPSDSAWQLSSHCWALLVDVSFVSQSALRKAVQTTAAKRHTTKHHKIRQNPQQSLGNASWKVCLWKHSLKAWISWIKLRPFSHEIKIFKATLCQNPQLKTATPLFQGPSRFAGSNQKANFKHHMHEVHQHASAIINVHQGLLNTQETREIAKWAPSLKERMSNNGNLHTFVTDAVTTCLEQNASMPWKKSAWLYSRAPPAVAALPASKYIGSYRLESHEKAELNKNVQVSANPKWRCPANVLFTRVQSSYLCRHLASALL